MSRKFMPYCCQTCTRENCEYPSCSDFIEENCADDITPPPIPQPQWDAIQRQTLEPACACDYCTGYNHHASEPEPILYCCDKCERGEPCRGNDERYGWAPYDQPAPEKSDLTTNPAVWSLVMDDVDHTFSDDIFTPERLKRDMAARNQAGIKRYGTPLQIFNGRDALKDAYQEALDCTVYLKQTLVECTDPKRCSKIRRMYRSMICALQDYCDIVEEE